MAALILGILVALCHGSVSAEAQLPHWAPGAEVGFGHVSDLTAEWESGTIVDGQITATDWTLTVTAIEQRSLAYCGEEREVYVVSFEDESFSGAAYVMMSEPMPIATNVLLERGRISGEAWICTSDLSVAAIHAEAEAAVWVFLFSEWMEVGNIHLLESSTEFCAPLEDFRWPLAPGLTWALTSSVRSAGYYNVELNLFGKPYCLDEWFEETLELGFDGGCTGIETVNGCESYVIEMEDRNGEGSMRSWYCPASVMPWYARKSISNLGLAMADGEFRINSFQLDAVHQPAPTPEPSVTPTGGPEMVLDLNGRRYHAGERFVLSAHLSGGPFAADEYIALEAYGRYWFWPRWSEDVACVEVSVPISPGLEETILDFVWPENAGSLPGATFWGVLLVPGGTTVYAVDTVGFSAE